MSSHMCHPSLRSIQGRQKKVRAVSRAKCNRWVKCNPLVGTLLAEDLSRQGNRMNAIVVDSENTR